MTREIPHAQHPLATVLAADDDPSMRLLLQHALERAGCAVALAEDGLQVVTLALANHARFDLLILDVTMPRMDGIEACRRVRATSNVPIILLTARDSEEDIIRGLDAGADDYLRKPIAAGELLARVRAALRRTQINANLPTPSVRTGGLEIDLIKRLASRDGHELLTLTQTERRILTYLARHLGRIVSPDEILAQVWGPGYAGDTRLVQVNISRLRHKVEPDPAHPTYIHTITSEGYMLAKLPARTTRRAGNKRG